MIASLAPPPPPLLLLLPLPLLLLLPLLLTSLLPVLLPVLLRLLLPLSPQPPLLLLLVSGAGSAPTPSAVSESAASESHAVPEKPAKQAHTPAGVHLPWPLQDAGQPILDTRLQSLPKKPISHAHLQVCVLHLPCPAQWPGHEVLAEVLTWSHDLPTNPLKQEHEPLSHRPRPLHEFGQKSAGRGSKNNQCEGSRICVLAHSPSVASMHAGPPKPLSQWHVSSRRQMPRP